MKNSSLIEALLFSRAEPWTKSELAKVLERSTDEINDAILELDKELENRGICLIQSEENITLGTRKEASNILEKIYKDELDKNLSKASIETLSIIMYGENVTRAKIDYIRGVNSGFMLRSLLVRGLIERKQNPQDKKSYIYIPTTALLATLGITNITDLPDYEKTHLEMQKNNAQNQSSD